MLALKQLQQQLLQAIQQEDPLANYNTWLTETGPLSISARLAIYRRNSLGSLLNALHATYPICLHLVGKDFFNAMAACYISAYPATNANLVYYGDSFAKFIAHFPPASALPYLSDVACLEWQWHRLNYHCAKTPVPLNQLTQLTSESYLSVATSLAWLASDYPLDQIWQMHLAHHENMQVELTAGGIKLALWRESGQGVQIREITQEEWQILNSVASAAPIKLVDLAAKLANQLKLEQWLPRLILCGWIYSSV